MNFKIYAVGSNSTLVKEIEDALLLILGERFEVHTIYGSEVEQYSDGSLYVCNYSQIKNLLPYIARDKIVILNLTPTSQFYVQVSSIPEDSNVYVFNNKLPYIETLINSCREVGINKVNYIAVPYAEMSYNEAITMLKSAKYIIGVERLLNDTLLSEQYVHALAKDVVLIGGRRVASVNSACEIISRVNIYLHQAITKKLTKMGNVLCKTNDSQSLLNLYNSLDGILAQISEMVNDQTSQEKSVEDVIVRSALNQIVPFKKSK